MGLGFAAVGDSSCAFKTGPSGSALSVVAVLNPLSDAGQRTAPILLMLRDALGAEVTVHLLPEGKLSELPIKSFYRCVGRVLSGVTAVVAPSAWAMSEIGVW